MIAICPASRWLGIPPNICSRVHPFLYLLGQIAIPDTNEPKHYICSYLGCVLSCDGTFQQKQPLWYEENPATIHINGTGVSHDWGDKRLTVKTSFCISCVTSDSRVMLNTSGSSSVLMAISDHIQPNICSQIRERNRDLLPSLEITNCWSGVRRLYW